MLNPQTQAALDVIVRMLSVHAAWAKSPDVRIGEDFTNRANHVARVTADDCANRELDSAVEDFTAAWERQAEDATPSRTLLAAIDALEDLADRLRQPAPHKLPSVATLAKQNVPAWQIAGMYGWVEDGRPVVERVEEELAKPGTHVGPDFVSPIQRRRDAEQQQRRADLAAMRSARDAKLAKAKAPSKVPIAELARQGVSQQQITKMHGCDLAAVVAACEAAGVKVPPADYRSVYHDRSQYDKPLDPRQEATFDSETRIAADRAERESSAASAVADYGEEGPQPAKRKRGRPRKESAAVAVAEREDDPGEGSDGGSREPAPDESTIGDDRDVVFDPDDLDI